MVFITFIDIGTVYVAILPKIGLFLENSHYLGIYICPHVRARARAAQDISVNIDPIDLKFGGVFRTSKMNIYSKSYVNWRFVGDFMVFFVFLQVFGPKKPPGELLEALRKWAKIQ